MGVSTGQLVAALGTGVAAQGTGVATRGASVERIVDFDTVLATAMPPDFPVGSLMRAHCSSLIRVERPDGSATEVQDCQLTSDPVPVPEFQGVPPNQAFVLEGGACRWFSDFWDQTAGLDVLASSFHCTVTPTGQAHVQSEYPTTPITCDA